MNSKLRIAAFPKGGTAYVDCLYPAIERCGIEVIEGQFSIKWTLRNTGHINFYHLHWPSFFYAFRNSKRKTLRNFIRFLIFLAIIKLKGGHILWTAHNLYPHDRYGLFYLDIFTRKLINFLSSKIFVHGPAAHKRFVSEFPSVGRKIVEIDHGNWIDHYPSEVDRNTARKHLSIKSDQYVFLFVGLCKEYKQLSQLVSVFKSIKDGSILLIAGKFQSDQYLQKLQNLAKNDNCIQIYNDFIPDNKLQYYLNACDMVVLPYSQSLTSGAAMLAISFGKPVIAPEKGSLIDMITPSCGILYNPEEPNALAMAITNSKNEKFSKEKILTHANSFRWERTAQIFYHTLKTLEVQHGASKLVIP